jgi:hypothetical protein
MRRTAIRPSSGTHWPSWVREHALSHQRRVGCLGPMAGMPGACAGELEGDHIRASGGMGMKSKSIATNYASLCSVHHFAKTQEGRAWRPVLIAVIARLHGECAACQRESIEEWGRPLEEVAA